MEPVHQCFSCKHFIERTGNGARCKAFDSIPHEILRDEVDHRKPYPGDNGIQWEADVDEDGEPLWHYLDYFDPNKDAMRELPEAS